MEDSPKYKCLRKFSLRQKKAYDMVQEWSCEQEIIVLHRKQKNEKKRRMKNQELANLFRETDFFENAKFIPGLANIYFLVPG